MDSRSGVPGSGPGGTVTDPGTPTSTGVLPELSCDAGASYCVNPGLAAVCNASGDGHAEERPCSETERCTMRDGVAVCILGSQDRCDEPGEFVTCSGPAQYVACGDNGFADMDNLIPCPAEEPFCRTGMGCTASICTPGTLLCEGNQVRRCNEAGDDTDFVENCSAGCEGNTCVDPCSDDGKGSYVGCDFYALYLDNAEDNGRRDWAVTVSNVSPNPVEIEIVDGNGETAAAATIPSRQLETFRLPSRAAGRTEIHNEAYRIVSSGAVTVHQFNPLDNEGAFSNDASLLFPTNAIGTDYLVLSWPAVGSRRGFVTIIATEEEAPTEVRVRPSINVAAGGGVPAMQANQWTTVTLQRGQVLNLNSAAADADFTGTEVQSDHPVVVFAGSEATTVPLNTAYADHLEQQLTPTDTWGSDYIIAKFRPRGNEPDVFRVLALEDNTILITSPAIPNVDGRTLRRGEFVQFEERRNFEVRGRSGVSGNPAPISVGQFMVGSNFGCTQGAFGPSCPNPRPIPASSRCGNSAIGDPAFLLNVPTRQFLSEYVFYVPAQYHENYISVVARTGTGIQLDGSPMGAPPQRVEGTPFDVFHMPVQAGVRTLTADRAVGLYVYGYDCDVSYAYPGGMNLDVDAASNF